MKKILNCNSNQGNENQTGMSYHFQPSVWQKLKRLIIASVNEEVGEMVFSYTVDGSSVLESNMAV